MNLVLVKVMSNRQRLHVENELFVRNDRKWLCVLAETLSVEIFNSWAESFDGVEVFRELRVSLQQPLNLNQLILTLTALSNLNAAQSEVHSTSDLEALSLYSHNSRANSSSSTTTERLMQFDSFIKDH